jgi:hypothetical protein
LAREALAPLLRWPLHSPRRLAALVGALVGLVSLLAAVRPAAVAEEAPSSSTASTSRPATSTTALPTSDTASSPGPADRVSPADVAVRFVTAWARPDLPVQQWQEDVIALATPEFGAQLRTVGPGNVPAQHVLGPALTETTTEIAAAVTVPTDAGPVLVDLAFMGTRWQVSGLTPAGPPPTWTGGGGSSRAPTYTPLPARS